MYSILQCTVMYVERKICHARVVSKVANSSYEETDHANVLLLALDILVFESFQLDVLTL